MSSRHLPVTLVAGPQDRAVVVGGGRVAYDKIRWLLQFGIPVAVISPEVIPQIEALVADGTIELISARYHGLPDECWLVVAATDNMTVNKSVYNDACGRGLHVNVVDQPELCTFFVPAVTQRGDLAIAVGTGGKSPSLAGRLKHQVGGIAGSFYESYLQLLDAARQRLKRLTGDASVRARVNRRLASFEFENSLRRLPESKRQNYVSEAIDNLIDEDTAAMKTMGTVFLVGAGPGDAELLTIKGLRVLTGADVIFYDGLVNKELLELTRPGAQKVDTSKRAGCALYSQQEINEKIVAASMDGKVICRLKGGDPCVFGRGGEEALALAEAGVPFEIVPGVTSVVGALSYAGIPVTHRDFASYFQVVTGHENPEKTDSRVNWRDIGSSVGTVVFLMGVHRLNEIARKLVSHGRPEDTPLAVISRGTLKDQRVFETTLAEAINVESEELKKFARPALIVVGKVVSLRKKLRWFHWR